MAQALVDLTAPIRAAFEKSQAWKGITLKAYPPPEKKVKKVKNKGTHYPNRPKPDGAVAEAKPEEAPAAAEAKE